MARILSFRNPTPKELRENPFKFLWYKFSDLDKFTKRLIVVFLLIALATPFIVNQYQIFTGRAQIVPNPNLGWPSLESLGVPLDMHNVPASNMWAEGNLLYGISTDTSSCGGPFFAYNVKTKTVVHRADAQESITNVCRNIMVDKNGNAYFGVNSNGLAKYSPGNPDDPSDDTVTVLGHTLPNFLRASTKESSSGWIYGATGQSSPNDIFRFNPSTDTLEMLGSSWGYTAHMVLDPNERYVYYIPDAHGSAYTKGAPLLQYDVVTKTHKVIAFLNNVYESKYNYRLGGTYALDMDMEGRIFINMNADTPGTDDRYDGFGAPVMMVVHVPDSERCVAVACPATPGFQFRDVASEAGIDGNSSLPLYNTYLHTSSWGDVDNDGWLDLFTGAFSELPATGKSKLLLNKNGKFVNSGQSSVEIAGRASGSVFADFDNDGDLDLYISHNNRTGTSDYRSEISHILANDGSGNFSDRTQGSGFESLKKGREAGVLDYNNDGLLDLVVIADNLSADSDTVKLMKNNGNFIFSDVTASAGIPTDMFGLGLAIGDVTNNGWPDIFIAGWSGSYSTGSQRNFMLIAEGNGQYHLLPSNVFDWSSFDAGSEDWMSGAAMADLNRDGRLDIVVGHHFGSSVDKNIVTKIRVYMNRGNDANGDPIFEDITNSAGIPSLRSKQPHVEIQDFDNDGWPDIYVSIVVDIPGGTAPLIYKHNGNSGDPTFSLASNIPSINNPLYTAGGPTADFNRDGKLDIFMNEFRSVLGTPTPSKLFQNTGASGNWLQVKYVDGADHMGLGVKIKIFAKGTEQLLNYREISPSFGWSSSQPAIAHFGLGSETSVDVEIEKPFSKTKTKILNVPVNRMIIMPSPALQTPSHISGLEDIAETDNDARFIQEPGVVLPSHTTASTIPTVDFMPYPHPDYVEKLWSMWGAGKFASNGKFYSAIGDHKEPDGNAYLYEYDPITKRIVNVGDAQTAANHVAGSVGYGKVHSQITEGSDGYIYFFTYRGSTNPTFDSNYRGDVILRYPLNTPAATGSISTPTPTPVGPTPTPEDTLKKNIVLILTDDQRWDTLFAMPILQEKLVKKGVLFTNSFVTTPVCCPSRSSLLSGGNYPHSVGILVNGLPNGGAKKPWNDLDTLGVNLQKQGYKTALIGKYLNEYDALAPYVPPGWTKWIGEAKRRSWTDHDVVIGSSTEQSSQGTVVTQTQYTTDYFKDQTIAFIEQSNDPFFVIMTPFAPHSPATAAAGDENFFSDFFYRGRAFDEKDLDDKPMWVREEAWTVEPNNLVLPQKQLRSLQAVDRAIGAIVDKLETLGKLENTVIIFTSDNGLMWGEHRLFGSKGKPYEESIRVPLVIRMPGNIVKTEDKMTVSNLDVGSTIYDIAGIQKTSDGLSLLPLLRGEDIAWRQNILIENFYPQSSESENRPQWAGIRTPEFKYIEYPSGEKEFYDLTNDPFEMENQQSNPSFQTTIGELNTLLEQSKGLQILTEEIPDAIVGKEYFFQLQAWGGTEPYSWSIEKRALPQGLSLDQATGVISGIPLSVDEKNPQIQVQDSSSNMHSKTSQKFIKNLTIVVQNVSITPTLPPGVTPTITPTPTPAKVTVQGRHVDENGNVLTTNIGQSVILNDGLLSDTTSLGAWDFSGINPDIYTVTANLISGYTISHSICLNCAPPIAPYILGDTVTVDLLQEGTYADIYFKYTPVLAVTPTLIPTLEPTAVPTQPQDQNNNNNNNNNNQSSNNTSNNNPPSSPTTTTTVDLNSDGKVNIFDLSILLRNWNKAGQGDLNSDGKVNIFDLSILLRGWK